MDRRKLEARSLVKGVLLLVSLSGLWPSAALAQTACNRGCGPRLGGQIGDDRDGGARLLMVTPSAPFDNGPGQSYLPSEATCEARGPAVAGGSDTIHAERETLQVGTFHSPSAIGPTYFFRSTTHECLMPALTAEGTLADVPATIRSVQSHFAVVDLHTTMNVAGNGGYVSTRLITTVVLARNPLRVVYSVVTRQDGRRSMTEEECSGPGGPWRGPPGTDERVSCGNLGSGYSVAVHRRYPRPRTRGNVLSIYHTGGWHRYRLTDAGMVLVSGGAQ